MDALQAEWKEKTEKSEDGSRALIHNRAKINAHVREIREAVSMIDPTITVRNLHGKLFTFILDLPA